MNEHDMLFGLLEHSLPIPGGLRFRIIAFYCKGFRDDTLPL